MSKAHGQGQARFGDLNVAQVPRGRTKYCLLEFEAEKTGEAEVVSKTLARTPPSTHAGGQDDGSYTNSLKI